MDAAMRCGVVLAGGTGSRLMPLTRATNKHLMPVYNKPMIYHSIETLRAVGCSDVLVVTGGEHIGDIAETIGDGKDLGVYVTYRVQNAADGIAGAVACAEGYVGGLFPVILGDNYFFTPPELSEQPCILTKEVPNPNAFGVLSDSTGLIVEKPTEPIGNKAVLGFYVYDDMVFDYIRKLEKSERGEYEITDVNNMYLIDHGMDICEYNSPWLDMGSFDGLQQASILEKGKYGI